LVKLNIGFELEYDYDDKIQKPVKPWEDFELLATQSKIKHLQVTGCNLLTEFPFMTKLCSLKLYSCNRLFDLAFPVLPVLESLTIID
jgi:hypothetical protein